MSVIRPMLEGEVPGWVVKKIANLEGRSKFCAYNAIRFLDWADEIFEISPVVASFCAMHATEEAVASFISAAKSHSQLKHAKQVNLHDHLSKALVSILAQRFSNILGKKSFAFAINKSTDSLSFRIPHKNGFHYGDLHLSIFQVSSGDGQIEEDHILSGDIPPLKELEKAVKKGAEARNKIIYASNTGCPTGFSDPEACMIRETKLSLGLIWAAVDIHLVTDQDVPFVEEMIRQMVKFNSSRQKKQTDFE